MATSQKESGNQKSNTQYHDSTSSNSEKQNRKQNQQYEENSI